MIPTFDQGFELEKRNSAKTFVNAALCAIERYFNKIYYSDIDRFVGRLLGNGCICIF